MNSDEDGSLFTLETQPPFPLVLALWVEDARICVLGPCPPWLQAHACDRSSSTSRCLCPPLSVDGVHAVLTNRGGDLQPVFPGAALRHASFSHSVGYLQAHVLQEWAFTVTSE